MKTRDEIWSAAFRYTVYGRKSEVPNEHYKEGLLKAHLEVLLDIRELLTKKE